MHVCHNLRVHAAVTITPVTLLLAAVVYGGGQGAPWIAVRDDRLACMPIPGDLAPYVPLLCADSRGPPNPA